MQYKKTNVIKFIINFFAGMSVGLHKYYDLEGMDQSDKIIAEYIWIDGTGLNVRSKQRTLPRKQYTAATLPEWNYDGSSTYQAVTENSEVILKPAAIFRDPFRKGDNILVMCEAWNWKDGTFQELIPANTNFRHYAKKIWDKAPEHKPWYGIEQEYTLFESQTAFTKWPLGWPAGGYPGAQGPYYCSIGAGRCFGRVVMDAHYKACLYAGVNISGTNGEVMPGQWEYQVGPCEGVDIGDHLWIARYLLGRVAEDFNVVVSIEPKPILGDWNGAGCHTNYSTEAMRKEGGYAAIEAAIEQLAANHDLHIDMYGEGNEQRLTGRHETASMESFSYGVGHRGASVRIPTSTKAEGKGYLEDRRPASNIDPYLVGALLFSTTMLKGEGRDELVKQFNDWREWKKLNEL